MNATFSIHHVASVELERHVFDGFHTADLTVTTEDGEKIGFVLYSREHALAIVESAPVEDHRRKAS